MDRVMDKEENSPMKKKVIRKKASRKKSWVSSLFYGKDKEEKGFSILEIILVVAVLSVVSSTAVPMYRKYQINSDLNNAQALITQGISRARLLAQSGKNDDNWGFSTINGVLYQGSSYETRVEASDEFYSLPEAITISGIEDVFFQKLTGKPSQSGNITLLGFDGQQRIINIQLNNAGISTNTNDLIVICHYAPPLPPESQYIPDADLPAYLARGDTTGFCPATTPSNSSGGTVADDDDNFAPPLTKGILLLEPTQQSALKVSGNGTFTIGGAGIIILNSSNPKAATISGNGKVVANHVYIYGVPGTNVTGNGSFLTNVSNNIIPSNDPLKDIAPPGRTSPAITNANYGGSTTVTLSPGTYEGGISASSNATVTLSPGTYYIATGGFSVTGNASITGSGVTIFNTGGGAISIDSNDTVDLRAPSSGEYPGIVIYQDRTYNTPISLGGSNVYIKGTIYAARAPVTIQGSNVSNIFGTIIIALSLTMGGNSGFSIQ